MIAIIFVLPLFFSLSRNARPPIKKTSVAFSVFSRRKSVFNLFLPDAFCLYLRELFSRPAFLVICKATFLQQLTNYVGYCIRYGSRALRHFFFPAILNSCRICSYTLPFELMSFLLVLPGEYLRTCGRAHYSTWHFRCIAQRLALLVVLAVMITFLSAFGGTTRATRPVRSRNLVLQSYCRDFPINNSAIAGICILSSS